MARDTRNRILVTSLLLFNEQGEPKTTINEIADEVDISPGNLHYHFRRKSDIVDALMAEFQADAPKVLAPPISERVTVDEFWMFLHLLLEFTAAYRFLFRDLEALTAEYPQVGRSMTHFAKGLQAVFELYLIGLTRNLVLRMDLTDAGVVGRNLAVIALFSERFDSLKKKSRSADDSALRVAQSILSVLKPFAAGGEAANQLEKLATHYKG